MPLLELFSVVSCCRYVCDLCWFARLFVRLFVCSFARPLTTVASQVVPFRTELRIKYKKKSRYKFHRCILALSIPPTHLTPPPSIPSLPRKLNKNHNQKKKNAPGNPPLLPPFHPFHLPRSLSLSSLPTQRKPRPNPPPPHPPHPWVPRRHHTWKNPPSPIRLRRRLRTRRPIRFENRMGVGCFTGPVAHCPGSGAKRVVREGEAGVGL